MKTRTALAAVPAGAAGAEDHGAARREAGAPLVPASDAVRDARGVHDTPARRGIPSFRVVAARGFRARPARRGAPPPERLPRNGR